MLLRLLAVSALITAVSATVPADAPSPTAMDYTDPIDGKQLRGYLTVPAGASETSKKPAVIIVPDWDGVNTYEKQRAQMIASQDLGWIGFAADIYGADKQELSTTAEKAAEATFYRDNTTLFMSRINRAISLVTAMAHVNTDAIAIIGYCFGGTGVLTYSLEGESGAHAAVSFHGGLSSITTLNHTVHPKVLVLSGGDDDTSSNIEKLEGALNAGNATWELTRYADIEHAFTVWEDSRYNAHADSRSWESMKTFLWEAFGQISLTADRPEAINNNAVDYNDHGYALRGYHSAPPRASSSKPHPAVVILPDWDGVNAYEKERAQMIADLGYVGFAADIYGPEYQTGLSFQDRIRLSSMYRSNITLFNSRIKAAINTVKALPHVNASDIAMIGYCFGGTGVINYAMLGESEAKAVVSFHGGLSQLAPVGPRIRTQMLVLSGGDDDTSSSIEMLEGAMNTGNARWELSRYAGVEHGFTAFSSPAYHQRADVRSWESMKSFFAQNVFTDVPQDIPDAEGPTTPPGASDAVKVIVGINTVTMCLLMVAVLVAL